MEYNQNYIGAKIQKAKSKFGITGDKTQDIRLPPGQFLTTNFPVLDLGVRPPLSLEDFSLRVFGLVEKETIFSSKELLALPKTTIVQDFHCVTRWSKYDLKWTGVLFKDLLKNINVNDNAKFVIAYSRDGYSTNIPLIDCINENTVIAYKYEDEDIPLIHGGPVRLIVPHLYGWKSAKFLESIKFSQNDEPGFWETRGYHNYGDPWKQQRYS